jgi:hypothetical protein
MKTISWPTSAALSVVFGLLSLLAWKGIVPGHLVSGAAGAIVVLLASRERCARRPAIRDDAFSEEEGPTDRNDAIRTTRMKPMTREELERRSR